MTSAIPTPVANAQPGVPGQPLNVRIIVAIGNAHRSIPVVVVLAIIWLLFYSQNTAYLSVGNITNLVLQTVTTAILALGVVFVLLIGQIDLSAAALSGVCATVAAQLAVGHDLPLWVGIVVALAVGMAVTFVEAGIVVFGVPALIVTLGGMLALPGLQLDLLPSTFTVNVANTSFAQITNFAIPAGVSWVIAAVGLVLFAYARMRQQREGTRLGMTNSLRRRVIVPVALAAVILAAVVYVLTKQDGLPLPVLLLTGMLLAASYLMTQTRFGVHLFAVGGERDAAQRAGVPVRRMVLYAYLILGFCAAIAGMVDASRQLGVSASSGGGPLMLNAIAAAVVGGTSLFGGRGSAWSALLGALVIGSINNGVQLLGWSTQTQYFATGGVLVAAVAIDVVLTRGTLLPGRR